MAGPPPPTPCRMPSLLLAMVTMAMVTPWLHRFLPQTRC